MGFDLTGTPTEVWDGGRDIRYMETQSFDLRVLLLMIIASSELDDFALTHERTVLVF